MKLCFLPHVREGITPTESLSTRAQASIAFALQSPGHAAGSIARTMTLLGPGDVVAIEPRQVLRITPASGARDAEPDFFPAIEFDAPDLPWSYSPLVPSGTRVLPWIALAIIEQQPGVTVTPGQQGQSPWILRLPADVARRELPDLTDSWAWAHAQVACENTAQIADTLANHPDRTLSRLTAARRLLPFRAYVACVVPAFLAGRIAGLGDDPTGNPLLVSGHEPAWDAANPATELPVYYTWSFRTGEAGDFELIAQRLHAAPIDASIPSTPLHLALPTGDGTLVVDWEPPLKARGAQPTKPRRPSTAVSQIKNVLVASSPTRRVLGPTYFGAPWLDGRPLAPIGQWGPELNLTPMARAAASLGADAVRAEQESLVAAAAAQLEAFRKKQREGRRKQLAAAFENRVKARLAAAPATQMARVFAPMAVVSQLAASNVGLYTATGRSLTRKVSSVGSTVVPTSSISDAHVSFPTTAEFTRATDDPSRSAPSIPTAELAIDLVDAVFYQPLVERVPVSEPPAPTTPVDPNAIPTGEFSPSFARPMSEALASRAPELMLPGAGSIAQDGALLVESDPRFVEAFLLGASQELNYELLWRGLPADSRATAFLKFWAHADDSVDIDPITTWAATSTYGSHVKTNASMILLVRSELVRRYPSVMIAAIPAAWNADGRTRAPIKDQSKLVLPGFRGRIGADVLYAGFSQPSLTDAIGSTAPPGPPGWYFLLSENPGDPRFGLDPDGGSGPPTRATLSWRHLSPAPDGVYAPVAAFPAVPDAAFTSTNATAASMAMLVRQRPFRAFLHASLLIRLT